MDKLKITSKELRSIDYPEGPVISIAMNVFRKHYKFADKDVAMELLKDILENPDRYREDGILGIIAERLIPPEASVGEYVSLNQQGISFSIFGNDQIGEKARHQIYQAAKLPISVAGALMPDAHSGYGLPIGGVLATENAVIPYGVGVDIGCRMSLSIFDIAPQELKSREGFFVKALDTATLFGSGAQFQQASSHNIMDNKLFYEIPLLKSLHGRAWKQLGSSGSGNHFAEFGVVEITEKDPVLDVEPGLYVGFLTHSGSRALGANIANHFTRLAISKRRLPQEVKNLAWLYLDEEEGAQYWLSMNLAGDYAAACHDVMHRKITDKLGVRPIKKVENHHNFAWKELLEGREVIVHRKGATPAGKDVLGVIPGSMTAEGFIVKGKGEASSINSAAHGSGRKMSRKAAIESVTDKQFKDILNKFGVRLLGGGLDESPFAYKDIHRVMRSQQALVEVLGKFTPKIVKMDGAKHHMWKKGNGVE